MPQRSTSAVIDLTSSQTDPSSHRRPSHRHTLSEIRGVKRRRVDGVTGGSSGRSGSLFTSSSEDTSSSIEPPARRQQRDEGRIESVDLTEINDDTTLAKVLAKQREDAIKAQATTEDKEGRTTLTATKCAICMDTPTDATTTVCGHMFCHKCILDSLRYEEDRSQTTTGKASRGKCPACRKLLTRKDTPGARRDLIPLQFKLQQPS